MADAHARIRNAFIIPVQKSRLAVQSLAVKNLFGSQDGARSSQFDWFQFAQDFSDIDIGSDYYDYNNGDYDYGDYDNFDPVSTTKLPIFSTKPSPPGTETCSSRSVPNCEDHFDLYPAVNGECRRHREDKLG